MATNFLFYNDDRREEALTMSKTMIVRSVVLLGQLVAFSPLRAQVYPYCAQYSDGASLDCSFSSLSMCEQSVSGVGGICILNPRGGAPSSAIAAPPSFNPAYVPPPPISQPQSNIAPIQSFSSDLAIGGTAPATLGAITFNSDGSNCIGLFRRMSCGGP